MVKGGQVSGASVDRRPGNGTALDQPACIPVGVSNYLGPQPPNLQVAISLTPFSGLPKEKLSVVLLY